MKKILIILVALTATSCTERWTSQCKALGFSDGTSQLAQCVQNKEIQFSNALGNMQQQVNYNSGYQQQPVNFAPLPAQQPVYIIQQPAYRPTNAFLPYLPGRR